MLRSYDPMVVGLSNRAVWRCPSEEMVAAYEINVGPHHVDVGPGTGYYLDAADLPQLEQLALVDANHAVPSTRPHGWRTTPLDWSGQIRVHHPWRLRPPPRSTSGGRWRCSARVGRE